MTLARTFILASALTLAGLGTADAQYARPNVPALEPGEILIQAQRSVMLRPEPGADLAKEQEAAIKMLYRLGERECSLVLETIAQTCQITSASTNVSGGGEGTTMPSIRASANFTLKVKLKS